MNNDFLTKCNDMLGDSNTFCILKGQLRNIQRRVKSDNISVYYVADLRVPRTITTDIYSTSFNVFHVCFNSEFVKENNINDNFMLEYKNNEVLVSVMPSCSISKYKKDGKEFRNNEANFYIQDILLISTIDRPVTPTLSNVVNL